MNKKMMPIVVIVIMAIFFFELYMIFKINSEEKNPQVQVTKTK